MNKIFTFALVFILGSLMFACSGSVSPESIYHSVNTDLGLSGAKNITVELSQDGMIVRGSDISVLARITQRSFAIDTLPENADLQYKIDNIALNPTGSMVMKAHLILGPDSSLPALLPMQGGTIFNPSDYGFVPGVVNSQNITIKINQNVGHTEIAGLSFKQEVVLNIWEDGIIEVDKEGVAATDKDGASWISKKVKYEGKQAILMVRD